jgi:hypothetical protein
MRQEPLLDSFDRWPMLVLVVVVVVFSAQSRPRRNVSRASAQCHLPLTLFREK